MDSFSYGVSSRKDSIRIPTQVAKNGKGYYEDRRPAANIDPYITSSALFSITCLDNQGFEELSKHFNEYIQTKQNINNH
jgi:glutamine synthetase